MRLLEELDDSSSVSSLLMGLARHTNGVELLVELERVFLWPMSISSSDDECTRRQRGRLVPLMGRKIERAARRSGIPTVALETMSSSSSSENVDSSPSVVPNDGLIRFLAKEPVFSGTEGA